MTLKCNAHRRTVKEQVVKAMEGEACNWNTSPPTLHLALIKLRSAISVKYNNSKGTFLCFTHTAGEAHSIRVRTYIFICITLHSNKSIWGDKRENRCGKGYSDIFFWCLCIIFAKLKPHVFCILAVKERQCRLAKSHMHKYTLTHIRTKTYQFCYKPPILSI